ncbi:MAG: P-loop NTPase [Planctomycetes bacterium]|nr:P-loop NTPase [Planctomycetota bacterium]MBL7186438.1 P-loop NTPase [Phycisphaerae bacterium]
MTRKPGLCEAEGNTTNQLQTEQEHINKNLEHVRHKILVLSGKGGVGKSTIAANLAVSLSLANKRVGLLDIDIHGPSIPKILNLEGRVIQVLGETMLPVQIGPDLKVMSIGFLLRDSDDAVIWRGPMKNQVIKQFLKDVKWGSLDFLIVDSPPGTGDEPLSIVQLLGDADGAIIVTTPQQLALSDVRKSISFCRNLNMPVLGVLENMSGFVCPKCGEQTDIFSLGGGQDMARQLGIHFLGRIPIDPQIVQACDTGQPYVSNDRRNETAKAFSQVTQHVLMLENQGKTEKVNVNQKGARKMRIAIPVVEGKLSQHFGHCETFVIVDTDGDSRKVLNRKDLTPPRHEPGVLPTWLHGEGVNVIIAGGMGQRAQQLFAQNQIEVVVGAPAESPESLVSAYLNNTLQAGENICDH